MAKKSAAEQSEIQLDGARLRSLSIRNFRAIGPSLITIDLDDILILIGENNVGKSTVLEAIEFVLNSSEKSEVVLSDFHLEQYGESKEIEFVLKTWLGPNNRPAEEWIHRDLEGDFIVERYLAAAPGKLIRSGKKATQGPDEWDTKVPWGAANVAKPWRPKPIRIKAFASPEEHERTILELLKRHLSDQLSEKLNEKEDLSFGKLLDEMKTLQNNILTAQQNTLSLIQTNLSHLISTVFPGYEVKIETNVDKNILSSLKIFDSTSLKLKSSDQDYASDIKSHGSGVRRTLLWAILKLLAEQTEGKGAKAKFTELGEGQSTFVLLIDEPELHLHPSAVRTSRDTLYALASAGGRWQVMITTHSPYFISFEQDHTTVARIRKLNGVVSAETVFRPSRARLDTDDKERIKYLNIWDPHLAEFFFSDRTLVVEGDTEYSIFRHVLDQMPTEYQGVHIVRARGKGAIKSLVKILRHFGSCCAILHDSDIMRSSNGAVNPAWTMNVAILEEIRNPDYPVAKVPIRYLATKGSIENALFAKSATSSKDKPYNAIKLIKQDEACFRKAVQVLDYLLGSSGTPPEGFIHWTSIEALGDFVQSQLSTNEDR